MKRLQILKSWNNFLRKVLPTRKFYVHEIAAVNLSKIYFLKNAKKICKPNNRDLKKKIRKMKLLANIVK